MTTAQERVIRETVGMADAWDAFVAPEDDATFFAAWIALLAQQINGAKAALLVTAAQTPPGAAPRFSPAAAWPSASIDTAGLANAAERAIAGARVVVVAAKSGPGVRVGFPILDRGRIVGALAIETENHPGRGLTEWIQVLHWASGWVAARAGAAVAPADDVAKADRALGALSATAALAEQQRLEGATLAFCNDLALHFSAERVALGLVRRGRPRIAALSHTAATLRTSALTAALTAAMAEAIHQAGAVARPRVSGAPGRIDAAHARLMDEERLVGVVTVPLIAFGRVIGALTLERKTGLPFDTAELAGIEAVAALSAPIIEAKRRESRWISGRLRERSGLFLGELFGKKHPTVKLATFSLLALVLGLALAEGELRVAARSVLEGSVQRAAVAPFQSFVAQAPLRAGDVVKAGDMLALLDDRDLRLERVRLEGERQKVEQRQREAVARGDRAAILVTLAQLDQAVAEIELADERLARTRIIAPIDGIIVSGDLSQMLGAPLEQGRVLFEIAPLDSYRLVMEVSEVDIRLVRPGQRGVLSLTGATDAPIPLTVTRLTSVAAPVEGRNAFRVEATIQADGLRLRPGMEGVGKIEIGRAPLLWVWMRSTVERARVWLWSVTP